MKGDLKIHEGEAKSRDCRASFTGVLRGVLLTPKRGCVPRESRGELVGEVGWMRTGGAFAGEISEGVAWMMIGGIEGELFGDEWTTMGVLEGLSEVLEEWRDDASWDGPAMLSMLRGFREEWRSTICDWETTTA